MLRRNARIHAAVTAVEARANTDFAVQVVRVSDRYVLFPLLWAAVFALLVGAALAVFWPDLSLRTGIMIEAGVFTLASLALDWLPLRLMRRAPHRAPPPGGPSRLNPQRAE